MGATTYCEAAVSHPLHAAYHGTEYGFPSRDDAILFERLVLEINQAGLSWLTVLKKREAFRQAFDGYDIDRVASFDAEDRARLLADRGIIRNRAKIDAVIANARTLQHLRLQHGSFAGWLDAHHPLEKPDWVRLFRRTFRFTGGEIVGEFLMSLGYLPGAHHRLCPVYKIVESTSPPWQRPSDGEPEN